MWRKECKSYWISEIKANLVRVCINFVYGNVANSVKVYSALNKMIIVSEMLFYFF